MTRKKLRFQKGSDQAISSAQEVRDLRKSVEDLKPKPPTNLDAMLGARTRRKLKTLEATASAVADLATRNSLQSIVDYLKEQAANG